MSTPSDPELVRRCLDGDEHAWSELTARYADLVYGVARRSGLGAADAGDVVQEVFLALLKGLGRLKRSERLLAWILKTARREAWAQVRRMRAAKRRETSRARKDVAPERLPPSELAALEEEQALRLGLRSLTERCRRLLHALFFDPRRRPYADIARDLGIAIGSIGPTRGRCLEQLRRELESQGFGPPDVSDLGTTPSGGQTRRSG